MKKLIIILSTFILIYACGKDSEAATNTVQYTLTVTADNGGSVTDGGTYDEEHK